MTAFGELTDQIHSLLHSTTGVQEQMTWLTANCTTSDTTLQVQSSDAISTGISEVGDELVYVATAAANSLNLAPFGRGFRGSIPVSHDANTAVVFNPFFPRAEIKRAINQCLNETYPTLYQIKSTTFTFAGAQLTYELPADCEQVFRVDWETVGPSRDWATSYGWRYDPQSQEASGKALTLLDLPLQGRTVKVIYQAKFTPFVNDDDLLSDVGFPESAADVLLYGVAAKLIRFLDVARLQLSSVENTSRAQVVGAADAGKIANQMYAMYQQRLTEERARLLQLNPPQMYFSR